MKQRRYIDTAYVPHNAPEGTEQYTFRFELYPHLKFGSNDPIEEWIGNSWGIDDKDAFHHALTRLVNQFGYELKRKTK